MKQRQEKVNSLLQREISHYLSIERPDEITGLLTITKVDVTPNLEYAKVYFSVIGQDGDRVADILKKNIYELQGFLNKKLVMRQSPRISFYLDSSGAYADKISKIIKETKNS